MAKQELKFYDMKSKKSFKTSKYRVVKKGRRNFAVAKAPSGVKSYRIISKEQYNKLK